MMGHQPSVENYNAITGNIERDATDVVPTSTTYVYVKRFKPPESGVFCGDTTTPLWKFNNSVEMDIPEDVVYAPRKEGIKYSDDRMPLAMNEFVVPDEELAQFNNDSAASEKVFKHMLYNAANVLNSLNESSLYVEAALRDGLDVDVEPDKAVYDAYVHTARLQALCGVTERLDIPDVIRQQYLTRVTELLAEESVQAMRKFDEKERQQRGMQVMRDVYHARVQSAEQKEDNNSGSTLGIRRSRT